VTLLVQGGTPRGDPPPGNTRRGNGPGSRRGWRPTLRLRLTVLYGAVILAVGALLLALAVVLVSRAFASGPQAPDAVFVGEVRGRRVLFNPRDIEVALEQAAREDLLEKGMLGLLLLVAAGVIGGYFVAGRALQPLSQVTATARRLSTETLDQRIALAGPDDELKELADTFDEMLARLGAAFNSQRRFVANASHELRTPLAVMRTEVDVALAHPDADVAELRRMGAVVRAATERADRLVDSLLVLARSEALARDGLAVREQVDLSAVVGSAVRALAGEAESAGLPVALTLGQASVAGDPGLLERLAGNLVENAIRHNVPGGWVQVRTEISGGAAVLTVSNAGPVLDPAEVEGLFEPFRRAGAARTATRGAGLGLSIVRAVASAHGGVVRAAARPSGGLQVVVTLPLPGELR